MTGSSLAVSDVRPRRVSPPWIRKRLEGTRSVTVGREANVRPDPGPTEAYERAFPTRYIVWDPWRQLFAIYDRAAPGWREFVAEFVPAPMPDDDDEAEEVERSIGHLPRHVDQGQLYVGVFAQVTYPFVAKRMKERLEFLELGSRRYAEKIADKNRAIGKRRIRATASDNAARLNEIRRYLPVLAGSGEKIPLVAGFNFTPS